MKKLLLTLTMILSVMALSAQIFTVTEKESGNVVENGASYYIYNVNGDEAWELAEEFTVTANEDVRLIGEKVEMQVVENSSNFICFGQCLLPWIYVSDPFPMAAGETADFSAHYSYTNFMEEVAGHEQIMKYYIYPANDPDNKFVINITFKFSLNGVEDVNYVSAFSNAYPTPASNVVNFDYSFNAGVSSAMVAVYNIMGQEVLRSDISGTNGKLSINVSDLADGVYFYSLVVNGKTEKSSKLVVRH